MAIKVVIPLETSTKSVDGLFQWDFGQALEIECPELGSEIVEVHFACTGMSEAIVRPCTFSDGIGTVVIPDQCLEQTSPITAWIYKIDSTQGHTIKTITLPISSRTRPCKVHDIPTEYVDKYNELIEQTNNAINAIENGEISVKKATEADHATSADSATNAGTASYATKAANADKATNADNATTADTASYATKADKATSADSATNATSANYAGYLKPSSLGLIGTCTVASGSATVPSGLSVDTLYFVKFVSPVDANSATFSGILYWNSASFLNSCSLGGYLFGLNTITMLDGTSKSTISFIDGTYTAANANGTLHFYKIGGSLS